MEYLILILLVYFVPTFMAASGRRGGVFVLNLAFGWTVLGWFVSLYLAVRSRELAGKAGV